MYVCSGPNRLSLSYAMTQPPSKRFPSASFVSENMWILPLKSPSLLDDFPLEVQSQGGRGKAACEQLGKDLAATKAKILTMMSWTCEEGKQQTLVVLVVSSDLTCIHEALSHLAQEPVGKSHRPQTLNLLGEIKQIKSNFEIVFEILFGALHLHNPAIQRGNASFIYSAPMYQVADLESWSVNTYGIPPLRKKSRLGDILDFFFNFLSLFLEGGYPIP